MSDTSVFLLHGLGSHPLTLYPLEKYLNNCGWVNTRSIRYNPDRENMEDIVNEVDMILSLYVEKEKEEIILIGQSMGGVVANRMHSRGWNVKKAIYIGSPLHGARMINNVEYWIPKNILNYFVSPAWEILRKCEKSEEPPHEYHTISMGWYNSNCDGRVFKDETMFNPEHHTHLAGEDHSVVFLKQKLWETVAGALSKKVSP